MPRERSRSRERNDEERNDEEVPDKKTHKITFLKHPNGRLSHLGECIVIIAGHSNIIAGKSIPVPKRMSLKTVLFAGIGNNCYASSNPEDTKENTRNLFDNIEFNSLSVKKLIQTYDKKYRSTYAECIGPSVTNRIPYRYTEHRPETGYGRYWPQIKTKRIDRTAFIQSRPNIAMFASKYRQRNWDFFSGKFQYAR